MLDEFSNDHAGAQGSHQWYGWRESLSMLFRRKLLRHGFLDDRTDLMPDSLAQPSLFLHGCLKDINFRHYGGFLQCAVRAESCQSASYAFRWFTGWVTKEAHQAGNIFTPRMPADLATKISDCAVDDHVSPEPLNVVSRIDVVNATDNNRWVWQFLTQASSEHIQLFCESPGLHTSLQIQDISCEHRLFLPDVCRADQQARPKFFFTISLRIHYPDAPCKRQLAEQLYDTIPYRTNAYEEELNGEMLGERRTGINCPHSVIIQAERQPIEQLASVCPKAHQPFEYLGNTEGGCCQCTDRVAQLTIRG